jgi:hypothetical protein
LLPSAVQPLQPPRLSTSSPQPQHKLVMHTTHPSTLLLQAELVAELKPFFEEQWLRDTLAFLCAWPRLSQGRAQILTNLREFIGMSCHYARVILFVESLFLFIYLFIYLLLLISLSFRIEI